MQEIYRFIDDAIEADRQRYTDIADQIWDHPETRFEEFWSAEHLASALESAGFTVTRNVGNIPNAFIASFGQGKPVIAIGGTVTRNPRTMADLRKTGIVATFGITPGPATLPQLLADTERNMEGTCTAIAGLLRNMA